MVQMWSQALAWTASSAKLPAPVRSRMMSAIGVPSMMDKLVRTLPAEGLRGLGRGGVRPV